MKGRAIRIAFVFTLTIISGFLLSAIYSKNDFVDERDGTTYSYIEINGLKWMTENLKLKTKSSLNFADNNSCGESYLVDEALNICPENWRLPTEKEVKSIVKLHKKRKLDVIESLNIKLCGRIDNEKRAKMGEQATFWIKSELNEGNIVHWHVFKESMKLHSHNVVEAKRQFPVRCVCELK